MARKRDGIELRGITPGTVFLGTICSFHGLWLREYYGVVALDVPLLRSGSRLTARHGTRMYNFADETPVGGYEGPLDVQVKVKRFSPWRDKTVPASSIQITYQREQDLRKGPRAVRLRDEEI